MSVMHATSHRPLSELWEAQKEGLKAPYSPIFPEVSNDYIKSCDILEGTVCRVYKTLYDSVAAIHFIASKVIQAVAFVFGKIDQGLDYIPPYWLLKKAAFSIYNYLHPINPINGQRQFNVFSRSVEKFLGDYIIYPYNSYDLPSSYEKSIINYQNYSSITSQVTKRLNSGVNSEILNPSGQTAFNYRTKLVHSFKINAFACPGGGMVVYDGLIKELERDFEFKNKGFKAITSSTVSLKDGSIKSVDLSDVTLEDVTAALIGHEMTHVASRHSTVQVTAQLIIRAVYSVFLSDYIQYEEEYEEGFHLGVWLFDLFRSRQNEFEADITGMYLAANAGYNPKGAIYLQEFLEKEHSRNWYPEFISTHPKAASRKIALVAAYTKLYEPSQAIEVKSA